MKSVAQHRRTLYRPAGFTILELLVTTAIVGVLSALLLPALGSAREAARRVQCTSQLKQLGLALHSYHEVHGSLPCGWQWEPSGRSAYGWSVGLLPYLEQQPLYQQTDRSRRLDDPANDFPRQSSLPIFQCPSDLLEPQFILYADPETYPVASPLLELPSTSYVGVFGTIEADDSVPAPPGDGPFQEFRAISFAEFHRGLSGTLLVGERTMEKVPSTWLGVDLRGEDAACRLVGSALFAPNCAACDECDFSSRHPGGANFLHADGRVVLISENIDRQTYQRSARLSGD